MDKHTKAMTYLSQEKTRNDTNNQEECANKSSGSKDGNSNSSNAYSSASTSIFVKINHTYKAFNSYMLPQISETVDAEQATTQNKTSSSVASGSSVDIPGMSIFNKINCI